MSQGLMTWDQNGTPSLSITERLTRVVSTHTATFPNSSHTTSISVPGILPSSHFVYAADFDSWVTNGTINLWRPSTQNIVSTSVVLFTL